MEQNSNGATPRGLNWKDIVNTVMIPHIGMVGMEFGYVANANMVWI